MQGGSLGDAVTEQLLQVYGARVVRNGTTILDIADFCISAGEHLVILGPNGAGKSTLVGLLTRDVAPLYADPAPVLWRGTALVELAEVRRLVGVVSSAWQDVVAVHLSVREVVLGGRFGTLGIPLHARGRVTDGDLLAADAAIIEMGLEALAERDMRTLSTGEARRALIARALVHDPAVVVFDEPCAGLDPTAAYHLRETMRKMIESGRTLVLVTHHVEDIVRGIDRAVLMADSHIVADGPLRDVLTDERLSALFAIPLSVEEREGEYRLW